MIEIPLLSGIIRKFNPATQSGIAPSGEALRVRMRDVRRTAVEISERNIEAHPGAELVHGGTQDWHGEADGDTVSFEAAAETEHGLTEAIDGAVLDENVWQSEPGRVKGEQDAPCRVQKRRWWG